MVPPLLRHMLEQATWQVASSTNPSLPSAPPPPPPGLWRRARTSWNGPTRSSAGPPPSPPTASSARRPERPRWWGGPSAIPICTSGRVCGRWLPCTCGYRPGSITWPSTIPRWIRTLPPRSRRRPLAVAEAEGCPRRRIMVRVAARRFWRGCDMPSDWSAEAAAWSGRRRRRPGWRAPSSLNPSDCRGMGSSSSTSLGGGAAVGRGRGRRLHPGTERRIRCRLIVHLLVGPDLAPLPRLLPLKRGEGRGQVQAKI